MSILEHNYFFCPFCGNINSHQNTKCINCQLPLEPRPGPAFSNDQDYSKFTFRKHSQIRIASSTFNNSDGILYIIEGGNAFRINNITRFFFLLFVMFPFYLLLVNSLLDFAHFQSYISLILFIASFSLIFYSFTYFYSLKDHNTINSVNHGLIGKLKNEFSLTKILLVSKSNKWSFYDNNNQKIYSINFTSMENGFLITPIENFVVTVSKNDKADRYYEKILAITAIENKTNKSIILLNNPSPKVNKWSLVINPKEFEIYAHNEIDTRLILFFITILIKKYFLQAYTPFKI